MALSVVLALSAAACSTHDPATEAPVPMLPGLYEVTLGGGTVVELKSGPGRTSKLCLDALGAADLVRDPMGQTVARWENCSTVTDEPKGNAMSGARQCDQRAMPMVARYVGSHTSDSFVIKGAVTQGHDEGGGVMHLGSGDFSLTGKRLGDCAG